MKLTLPIISPGIDRPTEVMSSSSSPLIQARFSTNSFWIWATMLQPPPKVKLPMRTKYRKISSASFRRAATVAAAGGDGTPGLAGTEALLRMRVPPFGRLWGEAGYRARIFVR